MIRKLKYITTVLLLVIFPISAIGLNISIHRCKHKGSIHFTLFEFSKNHSHSECCCSTCDISHTTNNHMISSCINDNDKKVTESLVETKISKEKEKKLNCCGTNGKEKEQRNTCKEHNIPKSSENGINGIKTSCCSNSDIIYAINVSFITLDINNSILEHSFLTTGLFQKRNIDTRNDDLVHYKNIQYPLKELIYHIISFIHTTTLSGDDTEVPNQQFC